MIGPDSDFSKLVKADEYGEHNMEDGANWDERNKDIVGFKREKVENLN